MDYGHCLLYKSPHFCRIKFQSHFSNFIFYILLCGSVCVRACVRTCIFFLKVSLYAQLDYRLCERGKNVCTLLDILPEQALNEDFVWWSNDEMHVYTFVFVFLRLLFTCDKVWHIQNTNEKEWVEGQRVKEMKACSQQFHYPLIYYVQSKRLYHN